MKHFKHNNVLSLIGVSFKEDKSSMIIIPYMSNGNLLSYIKDANNLPTVKDMLTFAIDIAKGIQYL